MAHAGARTVCYVERDAFCAAVLIARAEDGLLDQAPIWDDLATFDARRWRGVVDLVTAGFPCQPWSIAGKRKGLDDERWIWPDIARIVQDCEPSFVFIENVPGLYRHGLREVLSDLASLGFDAEWTCLSAADIGAPHRRERVFVLAYAEFSRWETPERGSQEHSGGQPESGRDDVEHADLTGLERWCVERLGGSNECPSWPPGPADESGWREWIASGGPEPAIRRGPDGLPSRVDQLRALGNAVVPAQAAAAFKILLQR
jgi:DNA (cytosine-5)-methyltransferase 1